MVVLNRDASLRLLLLLVAFLPGLTGCLTSSKYRLVTKPLAAAPVPGLNASTPPVELTVQTLIVVKGPGSWKSDARWDEYVVQVTNHGDRPATIGSATLTGMLGDVQVPGDDPWTLEKRSYDNWDNYGKDGVTLLAGAGVLGAYSTTALFVAMSGGLATANAMIAAVPPLLLVDVAAVVLINHDNKTKVEQEFARRRLALPLALAPGATVQGSWFFPMTPGPQRLVLRGQAGEAPLEVVLELKPFAPLHLREVAEGPATAR